MPASNLSLASVLFALFSASIIVPGAFAARAEQPFVPLAATTSSGLRAALQWLATNQSSDGSYGAYFDHWTAAAAYALWLNDTRSSRAATAFSWLATRINNATYWYWGAYGEADVPGAVLFSIAASQNLPLIQGPSVSTNLLQFQSSNGGFRGYYDLATQQSVTSSVDTAEALRGLINDRAINASSLQSATSYLFTLQNPDGSFNLTSTKSYDPIYSNGPEPVSITALILLALKDGSYTSNDSRVSKALSFLRNAFSKGFAVVSKDTSPVYSASLSALALNAFGRTDDALGAVSFILSHQDSDGGFRDSMRSSSGSNALDTGWATIALEQVLPGRAFVSFLRPILIVAIVIGVVALAAIVGVVVYLVTRNRSRATTPTN